MPLDQRTISVTCADPDGVATTTTRTLVCQDSAAPHLRLDFPQPSANLTSLETGTDRMDHP
jgi:hypothetical protein